MSSDQSIQSALGDETDTTIQGDANDIPKDTNSCSAEEKEQKYTCWGLGRGVDITKPTPWLNKTSFQVRRVNNADLIETNEGGLLKGYTDVVSSSTTIHYQVKAGVKAPDVPLSIGVDAENSHRVLLKACCGSEG